MPTGLDYTGRIPGSVLRQYRYTDVFRYLGDPDKWPKAMTQDEVNDLRANSITIHLNYEQTADFMLGGYQAGQYFAKQEARKWANNLGFSPNDRIYYSADFDVSGSQLSTVIAFLDGAANVDGGKSNVGVYGGYNIINAAINNGYAGWQAAGWAYGKYDPRVIAWQGGTITVNGVECDENKMNPLFEGVSNVSGQIPQSIRDKWPAIAGQFTGTYDDSTAILWADAGARYAAWQADNIMAKLNSMQGQAPNGPVNLTDADLDAIASRVAQRLAKDLSAG